MLFDPKVVWQNSASIIHKILKGGCLVNSPLLIVAPSVKFCEVIASAVFKSSVPMST
jgi:hypothetical protein